MNIFVCILFAALFLPPRALSAAGYGCPLQADIPVHGMMTRLQQEYPERRDELLKMLRIDPSK
ncbi:hypothetical protein EON64_02770 [archaeon]|nr:MAG: hypothetical protein EON64_02770 [archaeon]